MHGEQRRGSNNNEQSSPPPLSWPAPVVSPPSCCGELLPASRDTTTIATTPTNGSGANTNVNGPAPQSPQGTTTSPRKSPTPQPQDQYKGNRLYKRAQSQPNQPARPPPPYPGLTVAPSPTSSPQAPAPAAMPSSPGFASPMVPAVAQQVSTPVHQSSDALGVPSAPVLPTAVNTPAPVQTFSVSGGIPQVPVQLVPQQPQFVPAGVRPTQYQQQHQLQPPPYVLLPPQQHDAPAPVPGMQMVAVHQAQSVALPQGYNVSLHPSQPPLPLQHQVMSVPQAHLQQYHQPVAPGLVANVAANAVPLLSVPVIGGPYDQPGGIVVRQQAS